MGCSVPEAEDITQTALAQCYASWPAVTRASDTDAYVYRVLVNCLKKSRQRHWWRERPTEELPTASEPDTAESTVLRQSLRAALGRLSAEHRTVLVLRFMADMSERQVADVLGIPAGTVKSRLSRALSAIDVADLREETP
jgi:RNA polymerase sigma factor (sigma-70 family)